ncbi:MAG: UDP-N-acetylglucosamine--N-acetylmuramyl-(pentapeptide) pyrophosphoryl-undecaprenol N-acetylglucosamine transferase [Candidatus Doudnabacteria bacterium]|nr:UDP-N-acetylglucosamine--N-acetylmuramyl-(pentapeptide) pyrophosphoryl-undecaprenol N-acetylglucosamine transferase [Candidatus Doudnabacteria bacterium]
MKILLAGGGSGGPVSPVLAVALEIRKLQPATQFLFVGTKKGPERQMVAPLGIAFQHIRAAKLRRYFSLANIFIPANLLIGFIQAWRIVRKFKPDVVFSAGGYVAVPIAWAARMMKVRIVIHQQDAQVGLANKIIAPFADTITTAFEHTSKQFYSDSGLFKSKMKLPQWVGNPVREDLFDSRIDARKYFDLHEELPILLVLGGATGSSQINELIEKILPELVTAHQVVHQTGKDKNKISFKHRNYHPYELIPFEEYAAILKLAHLVIARAGLSTIAELSALAKPAIIIPMPHTHQEENAKILMYAHAAVVLESSEATPENLSTVIRSVKFNQKRVDMLEKNIGRLMPKHAAASIAKIILKDNER